MAVNNPESTLKVKKAVKYFETLSKENWEVPYGELEISDPKFGLMIKEAAYAATVFMNPVLNGCLLINHSNPEKVISDSRHVSTMCATYVSGNRKFTRGDIQQLEGVCYSLVKCVEALEIKKMKQA